MPGRCSCKCADEEFTAAAGPAVRVLQPSCPRAVFCISQPSSAAGSERWTLADAQTPLQHRGWTVPLGFCACFPSERYWLPTDYKAVVFLPSPSPVGRSPAWSLPYFNPDSDGGNWYLQKKHAHQLFNLLKFLLRHHKADAEMK